MDAARRSKRYPSDQPLLVRCDSWNDFVELYATDIGQGGMFIATEEPPPLMSVVELRMQLPESTTISLSARVVHVIEKGSPTDAKVPGVGVEFVDLDAERKKQIFHLLEFARWQGATGDPNASFARTMAELSPSMPPGKLADSLPANPPSNSPSTNPRKITLDGTEKPVKPPLRPNTMKVDPRATTLDGTQVPVRPKPQTSSQPQQPQQVDARKTTLDGKEKPVRAPARPSSGPVSATVANPASKSDKPTSDKPGKPTSDKPVAGKSSSDPARVKNIVTHFAHKRYAMGLKECAELLQADANDSQALKWQAMCKARVALGEGDEDGAAQHYEKALEHDEQIREARDFVRTYHRDKRLASLPFGRYFTKKK